MRAVWSATLSAPCHTFTEISPSPSSASLSASKNALASLTLVGSVFTGLEPVSMALSPTDPNLLFVANLH